MPNGYGELLREHGKRISEHDREFIFVRKDIEKVDSKADKILYEIDKRLLIVLFVIVILNPDTLAFIDALIKMFA